MSARTLIEAGGKTDAYLSIVLDEPSKLRVQKLAVHPVVHGDHVTIAYQPTEEQLQQLRPHVGKWFKFEATAMAQDSKGQALRVTGTPSLNAHPHVTVSCAEGVAPVYSNELLAKEQGQPTAVRLAGRLEESKVGVRESLVGGYLGGTNSRGDWVIRPVEDVRATDHSELGVRRDRWRWSPRVPDMVLWTDGDMSAESRAHVEEFLSSKASATVRRHRRLDSYNTWSDMVAGRRVSEAEDYTTGDKFEFGNNYWIDPDGDLRDTEGSEHMEWAEITFGEGVDPTTEGWRRVTTTREPDGRKVIFVSDAKPNRAQRAALEMAAIEAGAWLVLDHGTLGDVAAYGGIRRPETVLYRPPDTTTEALKIRVPPFAQSAFFQDRGAAEEFWAMKARPKTRAGDVIEFFFGSKPVATAKVSRVEEPGQSACGHSGKFANRWKVHWKDASFRKLGEAAQTTSVIGEPSGIYGEPPAPDREWIVAAAIRMKRSGKVYLGDHHREAEELAVKNGEKITRYGVEDGFWSNKGRFMSRAKACDLATREGLVDYDPDSKQLDAVELLPGGPVRDRAIGNEPIDVKFRPWGSLASPTPRAYWQSEAVTEAVVAEDVRRPGRDDVKPWLLTFPEYYKLTNKEDKWHPSSAYQTTVERLNSYITRDKFPLVLKRRNGIDYCAQKEPLKYVDTDAEGEIVRDAKGTAIMMSPEKRKAQGLPDTRVELAAFDGQTCVGVAVDEWGAVLYQVAKEYQGKGIGRELGHLYWSIYPGKTSGGFTNAGFNTFRRVHQRFVEDAWRTGRYKREVEAGRMTNERVQEIVKSASFEDAAFADRLAQPARVVAESEEPWGPIGYRAYNYRPPRNASVADLIAYEADELGNDDIRVQAEAAAQRLGLDLSSIPAKDALWVTRTREQAQAYGSDVREYGIEGWIPLVDLGGEGGLLLKPQGARGVIESELGYRAYSDKPIYFGDGLNDWTGYWLDPQGKFHEVQAMQHDEWASQYFRTQGIAHEAGTDDAQRLANLGWVRCVAETQGDGSRILHVSSDRWNKVQRTVAELAAIEHSATLSKDGARKPLYVPPVVEGARALIEAIIGGVNETATLPGTLAGFTRLNADEAIDELATNGKRWISPRGEVYTQSEVGAEHEKFAAALVTPKVVKAERDQQFPATDMLVKQGWLRVNRDADHEVIVDGQPNNLQKALLRRVAKDTDQGPDIMIDLNRDGYGAQVLFHGWRTEERTTEFYRAAGIKRPTGLGGSERLIGDSLIEAASAQPFPGSKVQRLVYHGTGQKFRRFRRGVQGLIWFTSDPDKIRDRSVGAQGHGYIVSAYVDIKNPADWPAYNKLLLAQFEGEGYDGAILRDGLRGGFDCFVFDPEQVRIVSVEPL